MRKKIIIIFRLLFILAGAAAFYFQCLLTAFVFMNKSPEDGPGITDDIVFQLLTLAVLLVFILTQLYSLLKNLCNSH